MTREEAISKAINIVCYFEAHFAKSKEAREDAANIIEALEQEPCEDVVSRQGVVEVLLKYAHSTEGKAFAEFLVSQINDLPSVTPQQKMGSSSENPNKCGKWRHYEGMLYCSKCGAEFYDEIMEYTGDEVPKYCPQCGQPKMQEVEG